jgi:SpoVK/Ycf46/Vps4 family AAA+-type ATPase
MYHVASNRIMVGLPTLESRELILNKLLSKENIEGIDFKELGKMTEGYSGSDLKVCKLILMFIIRR